ncbi:hypothetical protein LCGC14_1258470 [marine sediment metagenome]|uniref:Uncharacterized protein n=1 Tax=marine sediment metagenome TaxID=412755 RepID=A0A0F9NI37_9ZZZZ
MSERENYIDVLLPGFIEANNAIQFGTPCLTGTRIPYDVGLAWVWEMLDDKRCQGWGLTRERIIALAAFHAGVEWQRSRKRRARMKDEVNALWEEINAQHQPQEPAHA